MYRIKIIPKEELNSILPFLLLLNEKTNPEIIQQRLNLMKETNYQCIGIYDKETLIGISGIWILVKHYIGKHIEPDNVIIHPDHRGKNAGELLMQWIHNYAIENNCTASELNCYIGNSGGQKFWMNLGYKIIGYHMRKTF